MGDGGIDGFATLKSLGLDWEPDPDADAMCRYTKRRRSCLLETRSAANHEPLGRVQNGSQPAST